MKRSFKFKLTITIITVVLISVTLITSFFSIFINQLFRNYIIKQQEQNLKQIVSSLSEQYINNGNEWKNDSIHAIGMFALSEGYILKISDKDNLSLWDAQKHEMATCTRIMNDISDRMDSFFPEGNGGFSSEKQAIIVNNVSIGSVEITYWGPYFYSLNDFNFLSSVSLILISVAVFSIFISIIVGSLIARRLMVPISKTIAATKEIADGNYKVKITENTNTKELDTLIHSINHMANSLDRQEILRKKLTEDISHELRTPVTILQSHFEAIISGIWEPSIERLESCNDEVIKLGNMISNLEKLAKIDNENIKLNKTDFDLLETVKRSINSFEATLHYKNLKVKLLGKSTSIIADEDKIIQVITNLLSNAIKYTDDGDEIIIEISESNNSVSFSISDNGIGISKNEIPYLFERFYRTDKSRCRKTGGTGLGLAIVKAIVEAHKGEIRVTSEIEIGSTFTIILPMFENDK